MPPTLGELLYAAILAVDERGGNYIGDFHAAGATLDGGFDLEKIAQRFVSTVSTSPLAAKLRVAHRKDGA